MGSKINKNDKNKLKFYTHKKFEILKDFVNYEFIIKRFGGIIIIKCQNYSIEINRNNISSITKSKVKKINDFYDIILNAFKENKVEIEDIIDNSSIKLLLEINKKNNIEMNLIYEKPNYETDFFSKDINKLKYKFIDKKDLIEIINESYSPWDVDNTFCAFKSINNLLITN